MKQSKKDYNLRKISEDIKSGEISKIKLLGDSITHGVGGTGYRTDGANFVKEYCRNPNGYCWAKLLKDYCAEKYNCSVENNGCSGTNVEFIIENFDELIDDSDDLIFCVIGTNNRHQYKTTGERKTRETLGKRFYDNILSLNAKFRKIEKEVVFIANIPASEKNEKDNAEFWRILHMDDVNAIYKAAQSKAKFLFISWYDLFVEYLKNKNETVDKYLVDGLHPNDEGYTLMFELLKNTLEI